MRCLTLMFGRFGLEIIRQSVSGLCLLESSQKWLQQSCMRACTRQMMLVRSGLSLQGCQLGLSGRRLLIACAERL
jgi:hypothetical protein